MKPLQLSCSLFSLLVVSEIIVTLDTALSNCPPLGPVLPPPRAPSHHRAVQAVQDKIASLQSAASLLLGNATGLSLAVASVYEDASAAPLARLSHTPAVLNTTGAHAVDGDTVFRIGSVSKVFTVLGLLLLEQEHDHVHRGDPVTKYLPTLNDLDGLRRPQQKPDPVAAVNWDDVTLDALASQLAGIGNDLGHDLANLPDVDFVRYGLPSLSVDEHTECGERPAQRPCTWNDFWSKFGQRPPVYAPYSTPVYSNMAYDLLGLVIERVAGCSYGDFIQDKILTPLNMTRTFVAKPDDDRLGFIPVQSNWWSTSYGFLQADGGFYSSANDLLTLGRAILTTTTTTNNNNTTLLPAATMRAWLQPHAHTSSLGVSVGAPWEIGRSHSLTQDGRLVDVYTKSGGLGDYNALFALIPDYGLVLSMVSAGPAASMATQLGLATEVLQPLVRAVEAAGQAEAAAAFAGTYASQATNSSLTLALDGEAGLNVTGWTMHGQDVFALYPLLAGLDPGSGGGGGDGGNGGSDASSASDASPYLSIRLFPTQLDSLNQSSWRAVYSTTRPQDVSQADPLFVLQAGCQSWSAVDNLVYGLRALDDFVFAMDPTTGKATGIAPRAFRQTLARVEI